MIDWESIARKAKYVIKDREASIDSYYDMFDCGEIDENELKSLCKLQETEMEKNYKEFHFAVNRMKKTSAV